MNKKKYLLSILKAFAIIAVQKWFDPWFIGWLDEKKVEKGCFLYMNKKQSLS